VSEGPGLGPAQGWIVASTILFHGNCSAPSRDGLLPVPIMYPPHTFYIFQVPDTMFFGKLKAATGINLMNVNLNFQISHII
jgi:hypothetical protein